MPSIRVTAFCRRTRSLHAVARRRDYLYRSRCRDDGGDGRQDSCPQANDCGRRTRGSRNGTTFAECRRSRAHLQRDRYPVMLKASMGGGGKGMRLIHNESEVVEAYNTARSESMSSFGDDTVYLEKVRGRTPPHRVPDIGRQPRQRHPPLRPRMFRAAPQSEGGRRKPVTLPYAGIAPGDGGEGGCRSQGSELLRCRYHRVSGRQEPSVLLPRNEYALASGAPHHGRSGRRGPGERANPHC